MTSHSTLFLQGEELGLIGRYMQSLTKNSSPKYYVGWLFDALSLTLLFCFSFSCDYVANARHFFFGGGLIT
jgi:hypothetical protein